MVAECIESLNCLAWLPCISPLRCLPPAVDLPNASTTICTSALFISLTFLLRHHCWILDRYVSQRLWKYMLRVCFDKLRREFAENESAVPRERLQNAIR